MTPLIGSNSQKTIVDKYARFISKPKADFFARLGLAVVQGTRQGLYIEMIEGITENHIPMRLLDCRTSGGVFNLGHQHPLIVKAMKEGIEQGLDIGDHHLISEQRALLAEKLAELLPGDGNCWKTQFCGVGGEAVELAIKIARAYTKRKKIVSANIAYHGVTGMALAAGHSKFKDTFLWNLEDFIQIPFGDFDALQILDDSIAAVIMEPIPATGGILVPQKGYFQKIKDLCKKNGIIFIADEVQTGLGRTGKMWAIYGGLYEDEKIIPDIVVLAKGMSAGYYPMATCSYRPYLERVFDEDPFLHISTTGGSELGCHISSTMLDIISKDYFLENVKNMGGLLIKGLMRLKEQFNGLITDVRGRGLMLGIEFKEDRYGMAYTVKMIENGIFADFCGNNVKTVKIMPPLIIDEQDVEIILEQLQNALIQLVSGK